MAHKNKEVLKLAVDIYLQSKAYQALDKILDQVESVGLYNNENFTQLQRQVEDGLLDEKMNEESVDGLLEWWENQPRKRQNDLYVKTGLITRLIDSNDHESAYELTLEALKKLDDSNPLAKALYTQITRLQPTDNGKLLKLVEKRAKQAQGDQRCFIHRALGYLYVRNNEFGKAGNVFKTILENHKQQLETNDATMAAYVFEQNGDHALAKQVREENLKSVMSVQALQVTKDEKRNKIRPHF